MKKKPVVCVIDEDKTVRLGWKQSLDEDAMLVDFSHPKQFIEKMNIDKDFATSFQCVIVGRYFKEDECDIVSSQHISKIRDAVPGPLFLNWQGYLTKEELNTNFDGKLFHRYGVKWQTLRLRIQKFEKSRKQKKTMVDTSTVTSLPQNKNRKKSSSKPERCDEVLKLMASNAQGTHRERIDFFLKHDKKSGIALLEAIYNKLVTDKNTSPTCPSKYINSSPVIAKRILHDALYG